MELVDRLRAFSKDRLKQLKKLATSKVTAESVEVGADGPKLTFKLDVDRRAAWKLYVELCTRVATQPLDSQEGLLREALDSLYSLFPTTRAILSEAGPSVAEGTDSLGSFAVQILNQVIRPVLAKWHPALTEWEHARDPKVPRVEHERRWPEAIGLRADLEKTRRHLLVYADALAQIAGLDIPPTESLHRPPK